MKARFNKDLHNDHIGLIGLQDQLLASKGTEGELIEYGLDAVYPFGIKVGENEIACEREDFDIIPIMSGRGGSGEEAVSEPEKTTYLMAEWESLKPEEIVFLKGFEKAVQAGTRSVAGCRAVVAVCKQAWKDGFQAGLTWRPIDTKPNQGDGLIVLWDAMRQVGVVVSYDADMIKGYIPQGTGSRPDDYFEPTHWMPLPTPPENEPKDEPKIPMVCVWCHKQNPIGWLFGQLAVCSQSCASSWIEANRGKMMESVLTEKFVKNFQQHIVLAAPEDK